MMFKGNSFRRIGEVVRNPRQIGQGFKRSLNKVATRAPEFIESVDKGFKKVGDFSREAGAKYNDVYQQLPKSKLGDNIGKVFNRLGQLS